MFNPYRLEFARQLRGMTKNKLAETIGVTARTLNNYVNGNSVPDNVSVLAKALNFPKDFFYGDDLTEISEHSVSFRSMSKMSGKVRDLSISFGVVASIFNKWIESEFNLPKADLPDFSNLDPESAAVSLRKIWGLGEEPIANLIDLLELKGVRVYSLSIEANEVDAFSVWIEKIPFMFLNTMKSAERSRFDAAHELGHLVLDVHSMRDSENTREMEQRANAFASAFLMPRNSVIGHTPKFVSIDTLLKNKKIWGVSVAALARRMYDIGVISEWIYTHVLCVGIAKHGYRTKEPFPMPRETSQVLTKIFKILKEENITTKDIAHRLHLPIDIINDLTFGLSGPPLLAIDGMGAAYQQDTAPINHLKIIK